MFTLKIVLAVAFVLAGGFKVFRAKPMVDQFKEFGLPNFAVQLVGALEVLGAIGLFVPSLSLYATIGLILLMVGAVFNHLKTKHPFKTFAPALFLGIASSVLLYLMIN